MALNLNQPGIWANLQMALNYFAQETARQGAEKGRQKKPASKAAKDAAASAARAGASGTLLTRGAVDPSANLSGKTLLGRS